MITISFSSSARVTAAFDAMRFMTAFVSKEWCLVQDDTASPSFASASLPVYSGCKINEHQVVISAAETISFPRIASSLAIFLHFSLCASGNHKILLMASLNATAFAAITCIRGRPEYQGKRFIDLFAYSSALIMPRAASERLVLWS